MLKEVFAGSITVSGDSIKLNEINEYNRPMHLFSNNKRADIVQPDNITTIIDVNGRLRANYITPSRYIIDKWQNTRNFYEIYPDGFCVQGGLATGIQTVATKVKYWVPMKLDPSNRNAHPIIILQPFTDAEPGVTTAGHFYNNCASRYSENEFLIISNGTLLMWVCYGMCTDAALQNALNKFKGV